MTPKEIAQRLSDKGEEVAAYLLPNGKRAGHEWECGNINGDKGKSLKVSLTKNVWSDFESGQSGDYLDLWATVRNLSCGEAMREAMDYLGVKSVSVSTPKRKTYSKPQVKQFYPLSASAESYLRGRGLSQYTIQAFGVWQDAVNARPAIAFPYWRNNELLQVKKIGIERDSGKKRVMVEANCEPCLFGWQTIPKGARSVIICEGEIDAMSWYEYELPALSVPFGGGTGAKQQWIETEFDNLSRFDDIYLSMDMDEAGQQAVKEIAARLGAERCRVIDLPYKDMNECLMQGMTPDHAISLIKSARNLDPEELKPATDFVEQTIEAFHGAPLAAGFASPFTCHQSIYEMMPKFWFRESELTLINGINGHGKSEIVGQILLAGLRQQYRAVIASLELKPEILLRRLTRQASTTATPSKEYIRAVFDWYAEKLFLFNLTGTAKADRLLEIFRYANRRYQCKLFVIDSMMKCGIGEDDYNGQKRFVESLTDFVNETDSHVLLVTHSRKGDNEDRPTNKMDVKGSGGITDLADNLLVVFRNKKRERVVEKQANGKPLSESEQEKLDEPGAFLFCEKQREGEGWNGAIPLWFDIHSHLFLNYEKENPKPFVEYSRL